MELIKGTHHTALRCAGEEEFSAAVGFYRDVLGLKVMRTWGEGVKSGAMISTGDGVIELFADAEPGRTIGIVDHIALATDDVDACIDAVRAAGCEVTVEPHDVVIQSDPPLPIYIAFCIGKAGETIEFFCEK